MIDKKALTKQFSKKWKEYYQLAVLTERGFERKKCRSCGKYFWTCDRKRKLCGDSTCVPYSFIGKKFGWKHDYVDAWREFARFFQEHNRTVIPRYPTIARWRDDTWFVQASIYDFQPHVVSGEAQPPANPLIVAQPCFRFNDVENIGITSRHYSNFVMLGQHNFISGSRADWKEEDVGLVIDCLKHFKIHEKELTFVEAVWMGGGNAGPCFEVFAGGMELLTTVFMQYALTNSGVKDLPLKVIDFGWGLDRLAWLLNGTSTSYEITFDPVDKKFAKLINFKIDSAFLKKFAKLSANLDLTEEGADKELKLVARKLKLTPEKLMKKLEPIIAFYSILDHSKTLLFAIADGALPSNTGGGYNLRFLLRRALRLGEKFGWPVDLVWLAREHAQALYGKARPRAVTSERGEELSEADLMPMYPELRQALPDVERILEFEVKKYQESKQKIAQFLDSFLKRKKSIDERELVQLYESQGALPEDVQAAAEKFNVKVKIPEDFYSKIASKHAAIKAKGHPKEKELMNLKLPATIQLYYQNEKMAEFDAKVLKILDRYVILDKTAFYPTSGGQIFDTGSINRKSSVISVEKVGNVILHEVEDIKFRENDIVHCEIDSDRRLQLMRHHTAVHIVNGICKSQLGNHVWQAGSEKTPEKARLDITHYQNLTREELVRIENLANEIVLASLQINKKVFPRADAEKKYGMRIYQGGAVPGNTIRIVEIPGIDVEACGGIHCNNTIEVGPIKILSSKRIQDGIIRLELVAGKRAIEELQKSENYLQSASQVFSVTEEQLPKTCERFFREWKDLRKEIEKLKQKPT